MADISLASSYPGKEGGSSVELGVVRRVSIVVKEICDISLVCVCFSVLEI